MMSERGALDGIPRVCQVEAAFSAAARFVASLENEKDGFMMDLSSRQTHIQ